MTDPLGGRTIADYGAFVLALTGAGGAYLAAAYVLGVPELRQLLGAVRSRLGR
jgi:hypothetical protein